MKTSVLTIVAAVLLCTGSFFAGAELKVAVVDMGKLIGAHPDRNKAEAILQKQASEFEDEYMAMEKEKDKLKEEFDKLRGEMDNKALSEEARRGKLKQAEEKVGEIRQVENKIRETGLARRQQLAEEKRRMQGKVVDKIRKIVGDYAKKNDYTIVLDSASMGMQGVESLIYFEEKMDITDDILKKISKEKD